jgi:hypothetical protein
VNHTALVKTSEQLSVNPGNFTSFTSAEVLRESDISPVPSLKLQPIPRGGTVKNNEFIFQMFCCGKSETENKTGH